MKLTQVLPILLLSIVAHASQLSDAINKDLDGLKANDTTLANASSAGTEASQHYDHLKNDVLPLIQSTKARYEADVTSYNMENAEVKAAIETHNENRCMEDACASAYDAERDRLNAHAVQMQSQERLLDQRRDDLATMYQKLSTDSQETFQKIKQARADYDQALAERKVIENDLYKLRVESAGCKVLLKATGQGSNEALKMKCGNVQFDDAEGNLPVPPPDPPVSKAGREPGTASKPRSRATIDRLGPKLQPVLFCSVFKIPTCRFQALESKTTPSPHFSLMLLTIPSCFGKPLTSNPHTYESSRSGG